MWLFSREHFTSKCPCASGVLEQVAACISRADYYTLMTVAAPVWSPKHWTLLSNCQTAWPNSNLHHSNLKCQFLAINHPVRDRQRHIRSTAYCGYVFTVTCGAMVGLGKLSQFKSNTDSFPALYQQTSQTKHSPVSLFLFTYSANILSFWAAEITAKQTNKQVNWSICNVQNLDLFLTGKSISCLNVQLWTSTGSDCPYSIFKQPYLQILLRSVSVHCAITSEPLQPLHVCDEQWMDPLKLSVRIQIHLQSYLQTPWNITATWSHFTRRLATESHKSELFADRQTDRRRKKLSSLQHSYETKKKRSKQQSNFLVWESRLQSLPLCTVCGPWMSNESKLYTHITSCKI
jgi:hypothetical protein